MNLHEYQGKELLKKYGVKIQEGIVAHNPAEAVHQARRHESLLGDHLSAKGIVAADPPGDDAQNLLGRSAAALPQAALPARQEVSR